MLNCRNKVFKKLFLFSFIFLVFSLFCNKILHADTTATANTKKTYSEHVKTQQEKIISSLKKIERLVQYKEQSNDER